LLLQEFDVEIKDKKGVENSVANHLSRMQFENSQELPINDSLRDDMVFKITRLDPWYANIATLWLQVMYHQGRTKGSLSIRVVSTYGIHRTSLESALTVYSGDVYQRKKASRSLNDATHHHMEDIMGHSAPMQRFGKVDSFGQPCMKI
jgi:hypothetical protein